MRRIRKKLIQKIYCNNFGDAKSLSPKIHRLQKS